MESCFRSSDMYVRWIVCNCYLYLTKNRVSIRGGRGEAEYLSGVVVFHVPFGQDAPTLLPSSGFSAFHEEALEKVFNIKVHHKRQ